MLRSELGDRVILSWQWAQMLAEDRVILSWQGIGLYLVGRK
jgi:hypothetical protein